MAGIELLYAQTTRSFFNQKVIPSLSLDLLNSNHLNADDALRLVAIVENEAKPLLYFSSENQ